jgi:hypothetical protein
MTEPVAVQAENSSQIGYLAPAATPAPLEGSALEDFLQQVIVGTTGMDGVVVRPRWQPEPPNIPPQFDAWCAFGVVSRPSDLFPYVEEDVADDVGTATLQRHEVLDVLCSFYDTGAAGSADENAALLRDGLAIAQNREALQLAGFGIVEVGEALAVPSLLKTRWLYRVDIHFVVRRVILRTYNVLTLLTATATVVVDAQGPGPITETINVEDT